FQAVLAFLYLFEKVDALAVALAVRAEKRAQQQYRQRNVAGTRRKAVPPGRHDVQRQGGLVLTPHAVPVGAAHAEQVFAGRQVGVGGVWNRTGIDEIRFEALHAVGEAVVQRREEVQRSE